MERHYVLKAHEICIYIYTHIIVYIYIYDLEHTKHVVFTSSIDLLGPGDAAEDHDHQNRAVPADGRIAERHQGGGAVAGERGEDLGHPGQGRAGIQGRVP